MDYSFELKHLYLIIKYLITTESTENTE